MKILNDARYLVLWEGSINGRSGMWNFLCQGLMFAKLLGESYRGLWQNRAKRELHGFLEIAQGVSMNYLSQ